MLRCIAVDDEPPALEILESYIEQAPQLEWIDGFRDPLKALEFCRMESVDVAFLDIDMPGLTGLQLARLLANSGVSIVFCTAHPEFAVESYEQGAVDYLMKPIAFDRFLTAVDRVDALRSQEGTTPATTENDRVFLKSGSVIHQLEVSSLLYMKKEGHYMHVVTPSGMILTRMTVEELLDMLPDREFVRVHKSYVVGIRHIAAVHRHHLIVQGEEIPIGGNYRKDLLDRIDYAGS